MLGSKALISTYFPIMRERIKLRQLSSYVKRCRTSGGKYGSII